jgi:ketosteroid isomerase-like protein
MSEELVVRFFAALEDGDIAALREIYAPDAVIWHNDDLIEQPVEENLTVLQGLHRAVSGLHYEIIRRVPASDGVLQQHVLRGRLRSGAEVELHAAMYLQVPTATSPGSRSTWIPVSAPRSRPPAKPCRPRLRFPSDPGVNRHMSPAGVERDTPVRRLLAARHLPPFAPGSHRGQCFPAPRARATRRSDQARSPPISDRAAAGPTTRS